MCQRVKVVPLNHERRQNKRTRTARWVTVKLLKHQIAFGAVPSSDAEASLDSRPPDQSDGPNLSHNSGTATSPVGGIGYSLSIRGSPDAAPRMYIS